MKERLRFSAIATMMIFFAAIFSFADAPEVFYQSGYGAIFYILMAAMAFFLPYVAMLIEYGAAFKNEGIYNYLKNMIGEKTAFVAVAMWYMAFLIWITKHSFAIWEPLSYAFYGRDISHTASVFELEGLSAMGILAIALIIGMSALIQCGAAKKIALAGGFAVVMLNAVLFSGGLVLLIANEGVLASGLSAIALNQDSTGVASLSLLNFGVCMFAGAELVVGFAHKDKGAGVLIGMGAAAISIVAMYVVTVLAIGVFVHWETLMSQDITMANLAYVIMENLGYMMAIGAGYTEATAVKAGIIFYKFTGLSMFIIQLSGYIILLYSPLKQFASHLPQRENNKNKVPANVLALQTMLLIMIIALVCINGEEYLEWMVLMAVIPTTAPSFLLILMFPWFRAKKKIVKPVKVFKRINSIAVFSAIALLMVVVTNMSFVATLIDERCYAEGIVSIMGPILFASIAGFIYSIYEIGSVKIEKGYTEVPLCKD
ncbi:amino acid permease [Candidatus Epulonipiscium viviparus]|uniref:amino acid permease n=1 Tax=Candidatus Epulonipiscium viviparus TaxID=420336 RepID=UPI00273809C9|nr:amino acid permease [Candidatus Epulopiscium viviparus]